MVYFFDIAAEAREREHESFFVFVHFAFGGKFGVQDSSLVQMSGMI